MNFYHSVWLLHEDLLKSKTIPFVGYPLVTSMDIKEYFCARREPHIFPRTSGRGRVGGPL